MLNRLNPHNRSETLPMYANFASATLIVLGAVIAVLGFIVAGELVMVVTGLAAIFAGGLISVAIRERAN
jgi:hypothetical protein